MSVCVSACACVFKEGAHGIGLGWQGGVVSEGGGAQCDAQTGMLNKNPCLHMSKNIRVLPWINNKSSISLVKDKNSNQSCVIKNISAECVTCEEGK